MIGRRVDLAGASWVATTTGRCFKIVPYRSLEGLFLGVGSFTGCKMKDVTRGLTGCAKADDPQYAQKWTRHTVAARHRDRQISLNQAPKASNIRPSDRPRQLRLQASPALDQPAMPTALTSVERPSRPSGLRSGMTSDAINGPGDRDSTQARAGGERAAPARGTIGSTPSTQRNRATCTGSYRSR